MTTKGVSELYMYMSTAWPLVIKPSASEEWKTAKLRQLYSSFKDYSDAQVMRAAQKWTENNDRYPTVKNIITEIEFEAFRNRGEDQAARYFMERIYDDGTEYVVMHDGKVLFTWNEFVALPCNKEHIDPLEWERRFKARRKHILYGK